MGNMFGFIAQSAVASNVKVDKGPRPYTVFDYEVGDRKDDSKAVERAINKAFASFLRVDAFTEEHAAAFYMACRTYAAGHRKTVRTKKGDDVEVIDGFNGWGRPMGAIRAMLEGKEVKDPAGLMLHLADIVHGASAAVYTEVMEGYRAALSGPSDPAAPQV